jgi:putative hydrolase of the HAD superfamily
MIPRGYETRFEPLPKLVLFDLDNTLCDYDGARRFRTRYAFEPHFSDLDRLEAAVSDAMSRAAEGADHFGAVLTDHGIVDAAHAEAAIARYRGDRFRGLALFPEALEVVAAVAEVARVGMITNGPADIQRPKIELLEIAAHFPVIIVSGEVGVWKPDPGIFAIALERAGHDAADAIYVGDSVHHDIPGAHAAGMRSVWINRAGRDWHGGEPPHAEIRDLYELLPLLGLGLETPR